MWLPRTNFTLQVTIHVSIRPKSRNPLIGFLRCIADQIQLSFMYQIDRASTLTKSAGLTASVWQTACVFAFSTDVPSCGTPLTACQSVAKLWQLRQRRTLSEPLTELVRLEFPAGLNGTSENQIDVTFDIWTSPALSLQQQLHKMHKPVRQHRVPHEPCTSALCTDLFIPAALSHTLSLSLSLLLTVCLASSHHHLWLLTIAVTRSSGYLAPHCPRKRQH